jgi:tetratricopeptide (TPR) repeat protein
VNPQWWASLWMFGIGNRELGNYESSYEAFKSAYSLDKANLDVANALFEMCLYLGRADEAIEVAKGMYQQDQQDAGRRANLGFALLIAGRTDEAMTEVEAAITMDPQDEISQNLKDFIITIQRGETPVPKRWPPS